MVREFEYEISKEYEGKKISHFLLENGFSSHVLTQLRHAGECISVNGNVVHMNHVLSASDFLKVVVCENENSPNIEPVELPLNIIYEDEDIIVIDKQANMPIHPSQNNHDNSLANALQYYFNAQGKAFVFRCVNRLDKNTSGLTVVAKNMVSSGILSLDISNKSETGFKREYLAIVKGILPMAKGTIDAPIARVEGSTIERYVDFEKGERAVTNYSVKKIKQCFSNGKKDTYSLVKLNLETGRTHQIRVHLKHIGFPIIGDYIYNPNFEMINRHALHAYHLEFTHPITKKRMEFFSNLPKDMQWIE